MDIEKELERAIHRAVDIAVDAGFNGEACPSAVKVAERINLSPDSTLLGYMRS